MKPNRLRTAVLTAAPLLTLPGVALAASTVANPICAAETALFAPGHGQNITLPRGFTVSAFASGLNMPTGIAFLGNKNRFEVYVLESGHGLPSRCNEQSDPKVGGEFNPNNPFTPDIKVFNHNGKLQRVLGKPSAPGVGFQTAGPAVDIAFERGLQGGRLFATDSNQATHAHNGQNNSSRIVTVDPMTGQVVPFITDLPTGDHPTEQLAFDGKWIYWSQGSTTNSGVVGKDNGGGANQSDIPCQDITLSQNTFSSGGGVLTSGYSPFGTTNPGGHIPAFFNSFTGKVREGVCDGAVLRARLNNPKKIEAFSWGYRNGYAIRFAPDDHPLAGGLLVGEDGPDERGARPSNGAPDVLQLARQNKDGTPDYHGWPDRFGFLPSSQAVFNPVGGPSDDDCNPPGPQCVPIRNVLAFPPQPITAPLAIEAANSSFTGIDFAPKSFVGGPVRRGAALYALEGDFGFSAPNATAPAPEVGHEIRLLNFNEDASEPLALQFRNFARNDTGDQAFISPTNTAGFNRPTNIRFGPDGCAYIADYGAVRDAGADTHFVDPADSLLVQIPGTGVIWKICRKGKEKEDE